MNPVLEVRNLRKVFGRFPAVDGLDFEVRKGEVFGFLGPNGAGKTTTMRMMVGLARPTSGSIQIDGHDVLSDPLAARALTSFIPDRPFVYNRLTGFEFLLFVGGLYQMQRRETAIRAAELLSQFGLADWADALVETYSHGMRQRLVFSAALLSRPTLLVVDEPMVGLDPRGASLIKRVFKELCAGGQMSVFLSTHTMSVAEEVCDRIAIIHHGRIAALGTMDELRAEADRAGSHLEEIFLALTEERSR